MGVSHTGIDRKWRYFNLVVDGEWPARAIDRSDALSRFSELPKKMRASFDLTTVLGPPPGGLDVNIGPRAPPTPHQGCC